MSNLIANLRAQKPKPAHSNTVGWFLTEDDNAVLFAPPARVKSAPTDSTHVKSAARCPAVIAAEAQEFEIRCPYDLNIILGKTDKGETVIRNLAGDASTIRTKKLAQVLSLTSASERRYANVPMLQLILPYVFIADEPTFITQKGAHMHYHNPPMPGTTFAGRFPIDVWPRQLMWAFEWHEPSKPLVIKRGTPLCYVSFETTRPDRPIKLIEAEKTDALKDYMTKLGSPTNYVNQTFSLFNRAREMRPAKLLVGKTKS